MAFNGKLLELWMPNDSAYVEFPLQMIKAESYKVTPNQRLETKATRASTGVLVRTTVEHTASKIEFNTVPITNRDLVGLEAMFGHAFSDLTQRKLDIRYYDPQTDGYKTGTVYMPDTDYNIKSVDAGKKVVNYESVRYAFVEY